MTTSSFGACAALLGALTFVGTRSLAGQGGGFGVSVARWWIDEPATLYSVGYRHGLLGPFGYGLGLYHVDDRRSPLDRTQTGGDLSIGVGRGGAGLYGYAGTSLGMRHEDGNLDAAWSAGAGYQLRLLGFLSLGLEGGYRWEDTGVRGFWRLDPGDRSGFVLQGQLVIGGHTRPRIARPSSGPSPVPPPSDAGPIGSENATAESATRASAVAETALEAMGSPYRWGGSSENGYDCSGLIQWAYGEHGVLLPRTSRGQARMGLQIEREVEVLRPGDILGFASDGGGVSHVGMYLGSGDFIHSSSTGVRISSLTAADPDSRWWQQRWVAARRILN